MKVFVKKNLKHIIIMILMIAFFFISPLVHQKLVLRASTLVVMSDPLPPLTLEGDMYVDHLRLTNSSKGEYELAGWGFCHSTACTDLSVSSRKILLVSERRGFSTDITPSDKPMWKRHIRT